MTKTNRRRRELQEEHATTGRTNPIIHTPHPWYPWMAPIVTLPGKAPHRICRGRP
jgi:hypothetical protein